jgi:transketolase
MEIPNIFVFTHDSIGLGEDGPTHQPVEHLAALRAIPNLMLIRPADAKETVAAWKVAITSQHTPTALALTRQNVPVLEGTSADPAAGVGRGGYVVADWPAELMVMQAQPPQQVVLMGSGSEVHLAVAARDQLAAQGIAARVVSLPSWELFEQQPQAYRDSVLPPEVKARVAIEAGVPLGWERFTGDGGAIIAIDRFGASAPYKTIYQKLGLTADAVAEKARDMLA